MSREARVFCFFFNSMLYALCSMLLKGGGKHGDQERSIFALVFIFTIFIVMNSGSAEAQTKVTRISIATGGTGGVYYPLGAGWPTSSPSTSPNTEATAEVTSASVDNCKLIQARKVDLALIMADVGYDALKGTGRFKASGAIPVRTVVVALPQSQCTLSARKGPHQIHEGPQGESGSPPVLRAAAQR